MKQNNYLITFEKLILRWLWFLFVVVSNETLVVHVLFINRTRRLLTQQHLLQLMCMTTNTNVSFEALFSSTWLYAVILGAGLCDVILSQISHCSQGECRQAGRQAVRANRVKPLSYSNTKCTYIRLRLTQY